MGTLVIHVVMFAAGAVVVIIALITLRNPRCEFIRGNAAYYYNIANYSRVVHVSIFRTRPDPTRPTGRSNIFDPTRPDTHRVTYELFLIYT